MEMDWCFHVVPVEDGAENRGLMKKDKSLIFNLILLQAVVIIYTFTSIVGRVASGAQILSLQFVLFYGLDIVILGIYAICWQQMIKKFDLSIAYANRAMAVLWTAVWSILIFGDRLSVNQIVGIIIVMIGTVVVNLKPHEEGGEKND